MKRAICLLGALGVLALTGAAHADPSLTIYNQRFAVVRDTLPLTLNAGLNQVQVSDLTSRLEPDSVVLRDPSGANSIRILEQNFRADPASQELLLSLYEGQTIDFLVQKPDNTTETIKGRIVRSNYVPPQAVTPTSYYERIMGLGANNGPQPIIEVDGKLRFGLPGTPLFPRLPDETILKPTLNWTLQSKNAGSINAELGYVTGGLSWQADYNAVTSEKGDSLDLTGWITMLNESGKNFINASIKLIAGNVSKFQYDRVQTVFNAANNALVTSDGDYDRPAVTEKPFDEYHLYALNRKTTLRDQEKKQVEMVRAPKIKAKIIYLYDGAKIDDYYKGNYYRGTDPSYGTESNKKVWTMREFANTAANGLGIPLPKGRLRFYRHDTGGQLEFVGENSIDHTPQGETIRVYTGDTFDIVGERKSTAYKTDPTRRKWVEETFAITLRNRKKQAVQVRVIEHLYRWNHFRIIKSSLPYKKTDSDTVEFRPNLKPNAQAVVTYTVRYAW